MTTTHGDRLIKTLASGMVAFGLLLLIVAEFESGTAQVHADSSQIIGLDMQPVTNDPDSLGRLQPCTEASVGDEFHADVFVTNLPSLAAWELRLDYDPAVVSVELADYNQMLVSAQPSGAVFPSLFESERPGRQFMAATEINGSLDSGSGILARLTLRAVGNGEATLSITDAPATHGPRIIGAGGLAVGDESGDGIWDGLTTEGLVVVGDSCPKSTPIPTPEPTDSPSGGTPGGSGNGNGEPDTSNGSNSNGSTSSDGAAVSVVSEDEEAGEPGSGDSEANSDAGEEGTGGGAGQGGADTNSDGEDEPEDEDAPGNSLSSSGNSASGGDDLPLLIGAVALGAIAIGGGTLYIFRRRGTW